MKPWQTIFLSDGNSSFSYVLMNIFVLMLLLLLLLSLKPAARYEHENNSIWTDDDCNFKWKGVKVKTRYELATTNCVELTNESKIQRRIHLRIRMVQDIKMKRIIPPHWNEKRRNGTPTRLVNRFNSSVAFVYVYTMKACRIFSNNKKSRMKIKINKWKQKNAIISWMNFSNHSSDFATTFSFVVFGVKYWVYCYQTTMQTDRLA